MKTKSLAALVLGLASAVAVLPAAAQYGLGQEPGFYAGATLGMNGDDETAFRFLGGYQANRNFALELGYHDLGKHNIAGFPLESSAVEALGVGRLPLNQEFALYGKVGAYRSTSKGGGANERQVDVTFGAGFDYALSNNLAARVEWQRYRAMGGGAIGQVGDMDVFSVGALYRFR